MAAPFVVVEKALLLQEPHEHQAVQQHAGIPAAIALVVETGYQRQEFGMRSLVILEELLGDALDIQRRLQPLRDLDHGEVAAFGHVGQLEEQPVQLGDEKIGRLVAEVAVLAHPALGFAVGIAPALGPDPEALRGLVLAVDEEAEVLAELFSNAAFHGVAQGAVWHCGRGARRRLLPDHEHSSPGELGHHALVEHGTLYF